MVLLVVNRGMWAAWACIGAAAWGLQGDSLRRRSGSQTFAGENTLNKKSSSENRPYSFAACQRTDLMATLVVININNGLSVGAVTQNVIIVIRKELWGFLVVSPSGDLKKGIFRWAISRRGLSVATTPFPLHLVTQPGFITREEGLQVFSTVNHLESPSRQTLGGRNFTCDWMHGQRVMSSH